MTSRRAPVAEPDAGHAYLQIGEVAERTGVTQRTLRFYEEKGLLKPPSRMDGGFRLYSDDDLERVERIKRMQSLLGLSLADIKDMVEAEEVKLQIKAEYRRDAEISERRAKIGKALEVTEGQIAIIGQKLGALQELKDHLEGKLAQYRVWLDHLDEQEEARTP
jgi:DNA-binding transcriptional MerR regulator